MAKIVFFVTNATGVRKTKVDIREARYLLDAKRAVYEEVDVSLIDEDEREEMWAKSKTKTLPQVFVDDEYIGGYEELQHFEEEGILEAKLKIPRAEGAAS
eukprot:c32581_g1_i1.p1 GENE.c32581_g1_i1~~c32581_g1_i1.p1  ORF type:complete len:100 (-),score=33.48 c32581_g1_i1:151-450(-)